MKSKRGYYEGGTIPWLLSGEVSQGEIREAANFITRMGLENSSAKVFPRNTVLVAMYGATAGQVGILRFEAATNQAVCGILPNENFVPEFLFYFFLSRKDELIAQATGNAQPNISQIKIRNTEVPVVPLSEQQRIVGILDQAFAGIATAKANAEKNLQNARALFESHLQSVFTRRGEGWEEKKLGNVCRIARGGSPRPIQEFLTTAPDGINWIKISDATASGKYIYKTEQKIISDGARRSRMVHEGDFLLSNSMSFGRPYIMRTSGCVHDGWLILSDYASILHQDYLYYVLGSSFVYQQFDRLAAGSTVRNLNIELASRVEIPIPPLAHQQEIAKQFEAFSEKIQRLESVYQRKLAALDALKQSLLHQAFSGQL